MVRPWRRPATAGDRLVYRPVPARVLLVVFAAFGVWAVVDLVSGGRVGQAVLATLWLVAVLAALGGLLWRPAVVVDADAVELLNVVRDVRVPWSCLDDVTTRYTLTLHAGGSRHQSWAGAAPGRPGVSRTLPDERWNPGAANPRTSSRDLRADSGATAFMVEQAWRSWRERQGGRPAAAEERVEVRWRPMLPAVALGAVALAAALTPLLG